MEIGALIESGFDVHKTDDHGQTALFAAVLQSTNLNVVRALIESGADVNKTDDVGQTALFYAVQQSENENVVRALIKSGADVNKTDNDGQTALFAAVLQSTNLNVVRALIECGTDVNKTDDLNGQAALFYAVQQSKNVNLTRALIESGADVNKTNKYGHTALFAAVLQSTNLNVVRALIESGADVNKTDSLCRSPLFYAVLNITNLNVFRALIESGADVKKTDNVGRTALFYAFHQCNDKNVVRALIDAFDCMLNTRDVFDRTPIFYASNENVIRALIESGADVNKTDVNSQTALFRAVQRRRNKNVVRAMIECGADVNKTDNNGQTALFYAVQQRSYENVVRKLIEVGADVNETDVNGKTALFNAVLQSNNNSVIQALIKSGADINKTDDCGQTVLFYAVLQSNNLNVVGVLIDAGADVNKTDNDGQTALFNAFKQSNNENVIREFIESGADVNKTDINGRTALFYAVQQSNNENVIGEFIESGADVNKTDNNGRTALFYAVQQSNNDNMVRALIKSGADVNKTDDVGQTALFYAVQQTKNENVISVLIECGADINKTNIYYQTALFAAVQQSHNENVVRALIESGADVNKTDVYCQTALFYAVQQINNENVVQALIDAGSGVLNTRDVYGRTPMFYAWKCPNTLSYLLEKEGNPYLHLQKDNCNVSMLTVFTENCILFSYLPPVKNDNLPEHFDLLIKHGVKQEEIAKTIINLMFIKIYDPFNGKIVSTLANIYKNHFTNKSDVKDKMENIEHDRFQALELLFKLGADPNGADSQGNTALHYFTLLPSFHYDTDETFDMNQVHNLERFGISFNLKNHEGQTPLLFCLSNLRCRYGTMDLWTFDLMLLQVIKLLLKVCTFLVNQGSSIEETSLSGESVFHLIIRLFRKCLMVTRQPLTKKEEDKDIRRHIVLNEAMKVFSLFSQARVATGKVVNKPDVHLDTPLHLWAKLQSASFQDYTRSTVEDHTVFETFLKTTLQYFLGCKAKLNARNENEETPLHLCQTWSAVKLLVDAGANPKDVDSLGRSTLLVAAKKKIFLLKNDCFYPDVLEDQKSFWNTALEKGLDPWTVDHQDESVLSLLIESEAYLLAKSLVDMACEKNYIQTETIAVSLLNAICKDKSTRTHWKTGFVQDLLKKTTFSTTATTPLLLCCCRNLIKLCTFDERSVHWEIANLLLSSGADPQIVDSSGKSCLDIAESYPALKHFLMKPIDIKTISVVIPWTVVSKRHESKLAEVARRRNEVEVVGSFWYHKENIGSGSFSHVFAGINEKDGREVAIKRVERIRMNRTEVKREITNLIALTDCEHIVRYVSFFEEKDFSYVVLELMEGNLEDCFNEPFFRNRTLELSKDVVIGVKFLHEKKILHRDIKPSNILYKLYKTHPKERLKIADFGLSRSIDNEFNASTTVYGTNAGTRCWIAPDVLMRTHNHSELSDMFSCGLVLHYILSLKKHPFSKDNRQVAHEIETNITNGKMKGWDDSLSPEATHLLKSMLENDRSNRPIAREALDHPLFWSQERKIDLLVAVGNQPVFEYPRAGKSMCLTPVETDLEKSFNIIVRHGKWNDPGYTHMPAIYAEMTQKRKSYDTTSAVELVRLIRNAYSHVSEDKRPSSIRKLLLEDFVFLDNFPHLVMEVYKTVTTHGWDQTREEIKYAMNK